MRRFSWRLLALTGLVLALHVSCKKDQQEKEENNILADIDGNIYDTVHIGAQVWMKQNLKTTKYRNGAPIITGLNNEQWKTTPEGAYAYPLGDESNNELYGKLYNGYAVLNPAGLCPKGWHVPTQAEWKELFLSLGGENVAAGAMKTTTADWQTPNADATNSSRFTVYPAGTRSGSFGDYSSSGSGALFWSSTINDDLIIAYGLQWRYASIYISSFGKKTGLSCRCVLD